MEHIEQRGSSARQPSRRRVFRALGLGLITGAADDDPSAIGTYASAGAALGYSFLWTAPITFPMMFAVVYLSAKLGQVAGQGLFVVDHVDDQQPKDHGGAEERAGHQRARVDHRHSNFCRHVRAGRHLVYVSLFSRLADERSKEYYLLN
jgi:Natural resistance-associated macrophage protein-like